MRQSTMNRWIEAAEAKRVTLLAEQMRAQPTVPMQQPNLLMTKLRSMVRPEIVHRSRARVATRSPA